MWAPILWGGLIAGILDITDALVFFGLRGAKPIRILQSIAAGLLGPKAFKGGVGTAALGLALHFLIALCAAAVYCTASRRLPFLRRRPVAWGLLYGALVYLFMNFVVLPLAGVPGGLPSTAVLVNGVAAVVFLVGLPIALIERRYSS